MLISFRIFAGEREAQRSAAHEALDRAKDADGVHDACGSLVTVGDASSVPHLIRALRFFPDVEVSGPGYGVIDTQAHCVEALQRITGERVGYSFSVWKLWWDAKHPQDPIPACHSLKNATDGAAIELRGAVEADRNQNLILHMDACSEVIVLECADADNEAVRRLRDRALELNRPRKDLIRRENPDCVVHARVKGILDISPRAGWHMDANGQKTDLRGYGQPTPFTRYRLRVQWADFSDDRKYLEDPTSRHFKFTLRNTSKKQVSGLSFTIEPLSGDGSITKGEPFRVPPGAVRSGEFVYSAYGDCQGEESLQFILDDVNFADGTEWTPKN